MKMEIGKTYLRTKPIYSFSGGYNYQFCNTPIVYLGEQGGKHLFCYPSTSHLGKILGDYPRVLPTAYVDDCWETLSDVMNGTAWPSLGTLSGCKFYRSKPVKLKTEDDRSFDFSFDVTGLQTTVTYDNRFMGRENAVAVIAATKSHLVIQDNDGEVYFLDERYSDPNDWVLVG